MRKKLFNPVADRIKQHLKTFDEKSGKKQEGKKASAQSAKVQRFIKVFYTYFNWLLAKRAWFANQTSYTVIWSY